VIESRRSVGQELPTGVSGEFCTEGRCRGERTRTPVPAGEAEGSLGDDGRGEVHRVARPQPALPLGAVGPGERAGFPVLRAAVRWTSEL
jgi:hypothetical protein